MKIFPLFRVATLGLAVLPGFASAFELPRLCTKDKREVERVTLPAREIEVVNERPRIVVRETVPSRETSTVREVLREAAPVTTVYMPVSPTRDMLTQPTREVVREVMVREDSGFEATHRAIVRGEMAKLELQRTIEMQKKLLECYSVSGGAGGEDKSALEKKVDQLVATLDKLNTRMTSVENRMTSGENRMTSGEKLLMYHDTFLLAEKGKEGADFDGLKARMDNLEKLVLYLSKKATDGPMIPAPMVPAPMPK